MKFLIITLFASAALFGETRSLFDGKTLNQWEGTPGIWRVEDGAITASIKAGESLKKNEFLYWKGEVADFELSLEYKITGGPTANSGIQIRSTKDASGHAAGYQCDLDDGKVWLGRIYDEHGRALIAERGALTKISADGKRHSFPFSAPESLQRFAKANEWNRYLIRAVGHRIEIHINDIHFTTLDDVQVGQADLSGLLAVQLHSGAGPAKIQFRKIKLTSFEPEPVGAAPGKKSGDAKKSNVGIVPADAPNIGFEKGNFEGWTEKGNVFPKGPIKGDTIVARGRGNSNHDGNFWIGGYEVDKSDSSQGTMTSDPFKVTHPWAAYRIGAGPHPETRVEILDAKSGKVIHQASGRGEVEDMVVNVVDLKAHLGKMIRVRVVDEHSGHWGHINYDDFRFYQTPPDHSVARSAAGRLTSSPLLWNLQPNPTGEPGEITSQMYVPEGFQVETIAREPILRQPIAFTFDSRGRIWVAEAFAYPRRQKEGAGKDRIIILEDKDHDGTFESHKVFADNLNLISGFEIGYGGVFAACAPEFIFIPDADGDDRPDGPPQVLLDGFSTNDTHETPNSFLWGHDGYLYGCHGVFNPSLVGKPGTPTEERLRLNAAIWRFHPVTHEFEIYSHGGSNQWGLDYGPDGSLFMTHCRSSWGLGPVSQVIRDGHYWTQNNANYREFIATDKQGWNRTNAPLFNYFESIAAYGHGEGGAGAKGSRAIFGGHSHVGTMVYLGDNWPDEYRGNLFTHNLHGHQLNREILSRRDSAYLSSSHGRDILYCPDKRYLAVDLKYGPDGAVYSIDWQDTQQCHVNDSARWDRSNGRLYRMSWKKSYQPADFKDLAKATEKELFAYLSHDNEWFARMAQHQIRQRAARGGLSGFLPTNCRVAVLKGRQHPFRHLVAFDATGGLTQSDFANLLSHRDENIRSHAIHLLTNTSNKALAIDSRPLVKLAQEDSSSKVRLALAGACQHRLPNDVRLPILQALARRAEDAHDRFIPKMIWFGLASNAGEQLDLLSSIARKTPLPMLRDSIVWHFARRDPAKGIALANQFGEPDAIIRAAAVISQALANSKHPAPQHWPDFSAKAGATGDAETIAHIAKLNAVFGLAETQADSVEMRSKQAAAAFAICAACHQAEATPTGPSLTEISQVYDNKADIMAWVKKPVKKRENYPLMPAFDKLDSRTLELAAEHLLRVRNNARGTNKETKKILFLAGDDSHGWGSHQHVGGTRILAKGMRNSALPVEVKVVREWPADELLLQQDALVIYADGWGRHPANGKLASLKKFMDQGGGLTVIHWATGLGSPDAGNKEKDHSVDPVRRQWRNLVGADFEPWHSVSRFWDASFEKLPKHPVTRGVSPFVIHDECYFHLRCEDPECDHVTPLHGALPPLGIIKPGSGMDRGGVSALEEVKKGIDQYCAWGFERPQGGRTFGFTGGHTHWNWGRDELRMLIHNGIYWTTGAEVPAKGIPSERPDAKEMLAGLKGNPGWTEEGLQIMLDRAGNGELIKWGQYSRGPLPVGPQAQPKPKKDLGPGLVIEGESLRVAKAEGRAMAQAMQGFGQGVWSGDSQLWWVAGKEGATMSLEFAAPADAAHTLYFAGTKAVDYGIHSFTLNGKAIGKPQDFFQPSGVSHTGQVSLGQVKVKKGRNNLVIKATGTHPKAVKRYMFGLDFLRLAPAN
jgi:putative membrane-bound dehydrogenase-like protein